MLRRAKIFLPGDRARMILIAAFIGVMSGLAIIAFREAVDLVHEVVRVWGYEILEIGKGGWRTRITSYNVCYTKLLRMLN